MQDPNRDNSLLLIVTVAPYDDQLVLDLGLFAEPIAQLFYRAAHSFFFCLPKKRPTYAQLHSVGDHTLEASLFAPLSCIYWTFAKSI